MTKEYKWLNKSEFDFVNGKNEYEKYIASVIATNTNDKLVILDVGANQGIFSLKCSDIISKKPTTIYAFEPFQRPFECLRYNASICPGGATIVPIKKAVMDANIIREGMYLPNYTLLSGFHVSQEDKMRLEEIAHRSLDYEFQEEREYVECVRLDDFMKEHSINHVNLLKIDVEKSELNVLESLGDMALTVQHILLEVHEATKEVVKTFLSNRGFRIDYISPPSPPSYCLRDSMHNIKQDGYDKSLNTYLIWATNRFADM